MKKIFRTIIIVSAGLLTLSACHKDLEIAYDNSLSASNMWKDASDLEQSVPGIYQRMRGYFSGSECNVFYFGELRVGDYMWGPSLESLVADNFKRAVRHQTTLSASNTIGWSGIYSTIDQANAVLAHSASCKASESLVNWANAQAYFARAFCYFYVARIWGYAPLNLVPIESTSQPECYPEQVTPDQIYAQVEKDIRACEELAGYLESQGTEKYFGTKAALNMLKAEYALWMYSTRNGGESCLLMAQEALDALGLSGSKLNSDYAKTFDRGNKKNAEIVFALHNDASSTGGYQVYFCQPSNLVKASYRNAPVPISSTQWWHFSEGFQNTLKASEKAGDKRVATNLGYGPYATDGHELSWCNKLRGDMSKSPVVQDNDLIYYRYGLAVMMLAELKYYQKDYAAANAALNIIAKRAYGKDNVYTATGKDDVLANLVKEYFLEFPAEGVIWWALIRTGEIWKYEPDSEVPGQTFQDLKAKNPNILLWPIASGSLTKNHKLKQVDGWS